MERAGDDQPRLERQLAHQPDVAVAANRALAANAARAGFVADRAPPPHLVDPECRGVGMEEQMRSTQRTAVGDERHPLLRLDLAESRIVGDPSVVEGRVEPADRLAQRGIAQPVGRQEGATERTEPLLVLLPGAGVLAPILPHGDAEGVGGFVYQQVRLGSRRAPAEGPCHRQLRGFEKQVVGRQVDDPADRFRPVLVEPRRRQLALAFEPLAEFNQFTKHRAPPVGTTRGTCRWGR
jgi:hypothetical protein